MQQVSSFQGAGGRGEALKSAHTPQGVRACQEGVSSEFQSLSDPQVLKVSGGPPLPPAPTKSISKIDQKSNQKKHQVFESKRSPKETLKISKI